MPLYGRVSYRTKSHTVQEDAIQGKLVAAIRIAVTTSAEPAFPSPTRLSGR